MPIIRTELPKPRIGHFGEHEVSDYLKNLNNREIELWFNLELPGCPEVDLVLYHPFSGLFLIEIKSFKIEDIEKIVNGEIYLINNDRRSSLSSIQKPIKQIRRAQIQVMNYLMKFDTEKKVSKMPFIQTSVLFSRITSEKWRSRFNQEYNLDLANKVLFIDDIKSDHSLDWKLEKVRENPLLGVFPDRNRDHSNKIEFIRNAFESSIFTQIPSSKLIDLKKSVNFSQGYAEKFPSNGNKYLKIFRGAPGTGKSTILRQIALEHSKQGAQVLYLCFQKVLAAEMRREIEFLREKNDKKGFVEVLDLWDFYAKYNKISIEFSWDEIIDLLLESENFRNLEYDTILIDEAQDLPYAAFEMLKYISKEKTSVFIAYGDGQEIFSSGEEVSPAPLLRKWLQEPGNVISLRRSFRNSAFPFRLAQSFWENAPNKLKNSEWIKKKFDSGPSPEDMLPIEFNVKSQEVAIEFAPTSEAYHLILKNILSKELDSLKNVNKPNDLMVVVGSQKQHSSQQKVVEILQNLQYEYTDLTVDDNKRTPTDFVKIVTQVNARGLTAEVVVITDFEEIKNFVDRYKEKSNFRVTINNLGYICLSRSKKKTIILIDFTKVNEATDFLISSYYELLGKINE